MRKYYYRLPFRIYRLLLKNPALFIRNFAVRHCETVGFFMFLITLLILLINLFFVKFLGSIWFVILIAMIIFWIMWPEIANGIWICVCLNCGRKFLNKNHSICFHCDIPTIIRRRFKIICYLGHRFRENEYNYCPKCRALGDDKLIFPPKPKIHDTNSNDNSKIKIVIKCSCGYEVEKVFNLWDNQKNCPICGKRLRTPKKRI